MWVLGSPARPGCSDCAAPAASRGGAIALLLVFQAIPAPRPLCESRHDEDHGQDAKDQDVEHRSDGVPGRDWHDVVILGEIELEKPEPVRGGDPPLARLQPVAGAAQEGAVPPEAWASAASQSMAHSSGLPSAMYFTGTLEPLKSSGTASGGTGRPTWIW